MTPKERWLAALDMKPADRLPFWPKLDGGYAKAQPSPFRDMTLDQVHAFIGSDRQVGLPAGLREIRSRTRVETESSGGRMRTRYVGLSGETELVQVYDAASSSYHPVRFPVRSVGDIRVLTEVFLDAEPELDPAGLAKAVEGAKLVGGNGLTAGTIGISPLMDWVQHLAGVENAHYLLADQAGPVEALFAAIQGGLERRATLMAAHHPADVLYMIENTSTTLISPEQYGRYCAPHLTTIGAIVGGAGRRLALHMCGHLKALLPQLARVPARAFEAFTAPPLGSATLRDGRDACPDTCLIGGTHAMIWLEPAPRIIDFLRQALEELPHHRGLVLSSAGVMPPACAPETIRTVAEWIRAYPARLA